jgi:NADPH:quinone reductase
MLAARYTTTGASDVIEVTDVETPEPGPGQVRVRVAVSGVNPTDWKSRSGSTGGVPEDTGFQIPDQDGAGTIDAVGEGVDPARVGERVWVYLAAWRSPWGTAAQYSVVAAEHAVPLGDASFDLGASLGVPAITAHRCLFADGPIDGANVLVAGGAGAVGHAAIELAVHAGANVVATVSGPEKAELARQAGAHHVVNYRDEDAADQIRAAAPGGVVRIVEVDLAANRDLDLAVVTNGAAVATYADPGRPLEFPAVRPLMGANITLRFVLLYFVPPAALAAGAREVAAAVAAGALTTQPLHRFALADTAAAHDAVEAGAVGKVLIDVP